MIRLERSNHGAALGLYRASLARFPLVGAVLLDTQDGVVYVDHPGKPSCAYVEHAFGFAQILGAPTAGFEAALERYLFADRRFAAPKVRLYTPWLPRFLSDPRREPLRSFRQRFVLGPVRPDIGSGPPDDTAVIVVDRSNATAVEEAFGITSRFWRDARDFARAARAVAAVYRGQLASICYAAAEAEGQVEIDVLTRPEHQRRGLGKLAVSHFVHLCLAAGVEPLWDCFANNAPSMQLCRSVGFIPSSPPYPFYTITR